MRWKNWRKKEFFVRDFWFVPTQYGLKVSKCKSLQQVCRLAEQLQFVNYEIRVQCLPGKVMISGMRGRGEQL